MRGRTRSLLLTGATALLAVTAGFGAVTAAQAAPSLTPNVKTADGSFYTDAQIDGVWRSITASYPQPLPAGQSFPATAPAFFHPNDGKAHLFEQDLPAEIAARYWRCAWIGEALNAKKATAVNRDSSALAAVSAATSKVAAYKDLPAVAKHVDVAAYEQGMSSYAKSIGKDPLTAEYSVECEGGFQ